MRRTQGFTMIELLVVMTIAAIMLGIGVPSFKNFVGTQRAKSASYEIATSILIARSEAIKRNASVTLAPASGTDWTSGWNVAVGGTTLHNQTSMTGITVNTSKAPASITFGATGRPTSGSSGPWYWEIASSTTTRCVRLDTAGTTSTTSAACP